MNRRDLLTAIAGATAGISVLGQSALAEESAPMLPDTYKVTANSDAAVQIR
jgi:hypothetical protein